MCQIRYLIGHTPVAALVGHSRDEPDVAQLGLLLALGHVERARAGQHLVAVVGRRPDHRGRRRTSRDISVVLPQNNYSVLGFDDSVVLHVDLVEDELVLAVLALLDLDTGKRGSIKCVKN